jgi:predicted metal-dependent peptidase
MFVARERAPVHTYARPNRRFPARVGEVPGRSYTQRVVPRPTLLIAIDTSMSMTRTELDEIARQLRPMSEVARLVIVECDAKIHRVAPFDGTLHTLQGRGGTDLRPVFEPALRKAHRADGIVYFTDGRGPFPDAPPEVPVLFILTKPDDFACPWGVRAAFPRAGKPRVVASRR